MPASTRASRHASKLIHQRVTILPATARKLSVVARSLGLRSSPTGRLLDMCIDAISNVAASMAPSKQRGYGCLAVATIRAIRRSKDKIACIAAEHKVSEAMVMKIRSRKCYRWVR